MTLALLITAATGAWATDYTTLAVGDVIKVGDTFTPTADGAFNENVVNSDVTYTLMRADVDNDYNVTEKTDGSYYVFKFDTNTFPYIHFEKAFAVTAISDGLEVTNIENIKGMLSYTLVLHESAEAPAIEVTTNAASAQDLFTEASFNMPASDVTVTYELVRDLAVQTQFVGVPTEPVAVKKDGDKFVFASGTAPAVALIDLLADNAPILDGATYYFEKQNAETGDFEASTVNLLADAQPGTWRIVTTATADGTYDGTVRSDAFTLVEQYDLTVKPANDFSKKGLDAVTVGTETVTPDATTGEATKTGITPDTEVKLKAKRGYVIEKVEAKKHATK